MPHLVAMLSLGLTLLHWIFRTFATCCKIISSHPSLLKNNFNEINIVNIFCGLIYTYTSRPTIHFRSMNEVHKYNIVKAAAKTILIMFLAYRTQHYVSIY